MARTLRDQLSPVGDSLFRELLRECGVPLAPLVEGIRQEDLASLERTLLALAEEYQKPDQQRLCRQAVIRAKDHARLVSRNPSVDSEKRAMKEEMLLWMLTWLENPAVFELWVSLRKQHLRSG
jgi:hypothetical protein